MQSLHKILIAWATRCFGTSHVLNRKARSLRLLEESIELAQSLRIPEDQAHRLVDVVYSRPSGEPIQELGGVQVGVVLMAYALDEDTDDVFLKELMRILAKPDKHFVERNLEKIKLGF